MYRARLVRRIRCELGGLGVGAEEMDERLEFTSDAGFFPLGSERRQSPQMARLVPRSDGRAVIWIFAVAEVSLAMRSLVLTPPWSSG